MVVRHGRVVAEGWWAPYSAGRPHLLYSLTKSFTSVAVGLAIADGRLSLDDRVVDVLPDHVPAEISEQGRRITVHHLLSMTAGHSTDSLAEAWQLEPDDLVKGFLRVPFSEPEGTQHTYDNATTGILARMVERVTGRGLPELLDDRLFQPMGIDHAEWDRVASGAAFGFHGLHLTTEAVAAFGELLLRGGVWGHRQLIPREWVGLATRQQIETRQLEDDSRGPDSLVGYGYQFWMSRHGYRGDGAFGQVCMVVPSHDLVVVVTGGGGQPQDVPGALSDLLLPGLDGAGSSRDDEILAERLRRLSFTPGAGLGRPLPLCDGEDRRLRRGLGSAQRNHGGRRAGGGRMAPATRTIHRGRRRPRRMAGEFAARPPGRRRRCLAGRHVRRRPLRHHHPAPGSAGARLRLGDSGSDVEHRAADQPQPGATSAVAADDPARCRLSIRGC
jgi:CubicO group peptidase (beta-lactamase class C family)